MTTLSVFKKLFASSSSEPQSDDGASLILEAAKKHLAENRFDLAAEQYKRLAQLRPDNAGVLVSLAFALRSSEEWAAASDALKKAISLDPARGDVYYMLGEIELKTNRPLEAVALFRQAIERQPDFLFGHYDLVKTLLQLKLYDEAKVAADVALLALPDAPALLCIRGNLYLLDQEQLEALRVYQKAAHLAPDYYFAQMGAGAALQALGRREESLSHFARAVEIDASSPNARWALAIGKIMPIEAAGTVSKKDDSFQRAVHEFEAWAKDRAFDEPALIVEAQPFLLGYRDGNHREFLSLYGDACARLMRRWYERQSWRTPHEDLAGARKLRVGIASSFFREHSVWFANLKGLLENIDTERFEIHAFYFSESYDAQTLWAEEHTASFERGARPLEQWVQAILDRQLDVMIYPSPAIEIVAWQLACLRLVRRQLTTWGHPETTGLPTIDHYLSAELFEPTGAKEHYREHLVLLPGIGAHYTPYVRSEEATSLPGVDEDRPLVLCAGTPFKYQARYDALLVEIARRAEHCQFLFFSGKSVSHAALLEARIRQAFVQGGLEPERFLRFISWMRPAAFHALMARSTLMLDTIDFSGFNTAIQAIEAGLPIITCEGQFLRGRLASGVLRGIGLEELIVSSEEAYVELALRMIEDTEYAKAVRDKIRARRIQVMGTMRPIRQLEQFLEELVAS